MTDLVKRARVFASAALAEAAQPERAAGMQAYMRTETPFYGVQSPARSLILRQLVEEFRPADHNEYEALILGLWDLPHREEKYLALGIAQHFRSFVDTASFPLYRRLIVEGAWWDFVDAVATHLIGELVLQHPTEVWPEVDRWVDDSDMWLRRSAIICQVGAKERTDARRLFSFCAARLEEKEFFIRKAIGWALRDYAKTDPEAVAGFVEAHRDRLSGLSFREATKHIQHLIR